MKTACGNAKIEIENLKLTKRDFDYKSVWMMIVAAHFVILFGIIIFVLLSFMLCLIYIPGFMSGNSVAIFKHAPEAIDGKNMGTIMLVFTCATIENFGAGGFMALLASYVSKKNQTKDKTALLESNIPRMKK